MDKRAIDEFPEYFHIYFFIALKMEGAASQSNVKTTKWFLIDLSYSTLDSNSCGRTNCMTLCMYGVSNLISITLHAMCQKVWCHFWIHVIFSTCILMLDFWKFIVLPNIKQSAAKQSFETVVKDRSWDRRLKFWDRSPTYKQAQSHIN